MDLLSSIANESSPLGDFEAKSQLGPNKIHHRADQDATTLVVVGKKHGPQIMVFWSKSIYQIGGEKVPQKDRSHEKS